MDANFSLDIGHQTAGDRVRVWKQMLDEHVMGIECDNAGEDLQASVYGRVVASGSFHHASFTRQTIKRTPTLIRQASEEVASIAFIRSGAHEIRQGADPVSFDDCGIDVLDSTRPFEVDFVSAQVEHCAIHVPKAALIKRVGPVENLAFGPEVPLQRLVNTFAFGLMQTFDTIEGEVLDALLNQTLDLFALLVAQQRSRVVDPSTHQAAMLLRIKAFIKAHLRDESLTLERTARSLGISSRYVNALLALEQTSFGRYLLDLRLRCARDEIIKPRHAHKKVTEIAFDWGFRNANHFGRTFKEKFGLSPRDAKHQGIPP